MENSRYTRFLILILLLALLLRLVLVVLVPTEPITDFAEFDRLAVSVATGQGYVSADGNPTAYRPPGYPLWLAALYAACGHSWMAARLVNVLLGVLTCFLTCRVATQLFDRQTGLISALIVAGFPSHIMYANILATENLFIPLVLAACSAFLQAVKCERIHWGYVVLAGVTLGLAALTRPAVVLLPAVWVVALLWKKLLTKRGFVVVLLIGVTMVVTIVPWTVRNAMAMGEFIPIATEGGITFLAGHNEHAIEGEYSLEGPVFDELYAVQRTEAELDAYAYRLAFRFIRDHPKTELILLARKFLYFFKDDVSGVSWNIRSSAISFPPWAADVLKALAQGYYMVVALLAIASLFLKRLPKDGWYVVLYGLFVYWTAIHLGFYGKDRFRLPLMPVLAIFAAVTLKALWDRRSQRLRLGAGQATPGRGDPP